MKIDPNTVQQLVQRIANGSLSAEVLTQQCLERISKTEKDIGAWERLDTKNVLTHARAIDDMQSNGQATGRLQGIPVGIKDIYDTKDYPTCRGSVIHENRQTSNDCRVVEKLKEAGALILGKTVTTEFAFMHPSATRNPRNLNYSPGGSSSGSAASVAAGHAPLAIGSQTNGSVIRPASYCGVYGYKPSAGMVSRQGVLETSSTLDHVGVFGQNLADVALLVDVLAGYDEQDCASYPTPKPTLLDAYSSKANKQASLAWIDMPYEQRYTNGMVKSFEKHFSDFGIAVEHISRPASFEALLHSHKIIHEYEIVRALESEIQHDWNSISDTIKPTLLAAKEHTEQQYQDALNKRLVAIDWFKQFFMDYDAIITPAATGEAPLMGSTGDPVCSTIWTLCGLPCLSLPLLEGENGLPIGVQVVGAFKQDAQLFGSARYILECTLNR